MMYSESHARETGDGDRQKKQAEQARTGTNKTRWGQDHPEKLESMYSM